MPRLPEEFRRAYKSSMLARTQFGALSFDRPVVDHVPYGLSEWEANQIRKQVDQELRVSKNNR